MRFNFIFLLTLAISPAVIAGNSNSLLDVHPDGKLLAVANTDSGTVTVVDLKDRKKIFELAVGDHPEGVCWVGTNVWVTVYGDDVVKVIDTNTQKVIHTTTVMDEPYGIVGNRGGTKVYITHDYLGQVSEIDTTTYQVTRTIKVGPGARGIAISSNEKTLYVTEFHTTKLHAVDISTGKLTETWDSYESDNLGRNVAVHPTKPRAYVPHLRSLVNIFNARGSIAPHLSVYDLGPKKDSDDRRRQSIAMDTFNGVYVMATPYEAVTSPDGSLLYIIYAGTNDMSVVRTDEDRGIRRIDLPYQIGKHPRAIRPNPNGREVYIYNTLDFEVSIYDTSCKSKLGTVAVCDPPYTAEWRRGKELFQLAKNPMTGPRWVACASCHPDGLHDGRVWQNPEGDRRTPNMFGLAHTHPLHWSADRDEVQDFEYTIRGKLMLGRGLAPQRLKPREGFLPAAELEQTTSGLSADLDALAIYTNSFPVRLSPHNPSPGKLSEESEKGKLIFQSAMTRCAECHKGPYFTDGVAGAKPPITHDVGTGTAANEKMGPKYDTPTLLGVYRAGAWLHDGRAKTLEEVFTKYNPDDKHGKTSHLKKEELAALVSYIRALPYDVPPKETPNSVKYRIDLTRPKETPASGRIGR